MTENQDPIMLTVGELLNTESYQIPDYQRQYDWGSSEARQLLADIAGYAAASPNSPYYIGSLIVFQRNSEDGTTYYETIDGQQRLTTLTLLAAVLRQNYSISATPTSPNLSYSFRQDAETELQSVCANTKIPTSIEPSSITAVYDIIINQLPEILNEFGLAPERFSQYLFNNVKVLRVPLPQSTHLNHYFEIMNSRGEQLEKHEVLKAQLMSYLKDATARKVFSTIWNACANMSGYVQMHFPKETRELLFGEKWDELNERFDIERPENIIHPSKIYTEGQLKELSVEELVDILQERRIDPNKDEKRNTNMKLRNLILKFQKNPFERLKDEFPKEEQNSNRPNILSIISRKRDDKPEDDDDENVDDIDDESSQRFSAVIDFPNFLLQALKVFLCKKTPDGRLWPILPREITDAVTLDDKNLMPAFNKVLDIYRNKGGKEKTAQKDFAERFILFLLKLRFIFDKYVIKSETSNEGQRWSLKKLECYNYSPKRYARKQKRPNYINALTDAVQDKVRMTQAAFYVSRPTRSYLYWLQPILLHSHDTNWLDNMEQPMWALARSFMLDRYLTHTPSDYFEIVYRNTLEPQSPLPPDQELDLFLNKGCKVENFIFNFYDLARYRINQSQWSNFEFTRRNSVEHFYPQHPEHRSPLDSRWLNSFGNLCLVDRNTNSHLTNNSPNEKAIKLDRETKGRLSIKLQEMVERTKLRGVWDSISITEFEQDCRNCLKNALRRQIPL